MNFNDVQLKINVGELDYHALLLSVYSMDYLSCVSV